VSLRSALREDLVDNTVLAELIAQRMRIDADAALCPSCALRPITVPTTGLCRCCHVARLTEAQREVLAEVEANRGHYVARQRVCRARKAAGIAIGERHHERAT
jgi:hypothetical protein